MIRINLLHEDALQGAKVKKSAVYDELERISLVIGRNFNQFLFDNEEGFYLEAEEGTFSPKQWGQLPPYGISPSLNPKELADSPEGFALFFLTVTGLPLLSYQQDWADHCWDSWSRRKKALIIAARGLGKSIFMRSLLAYGVGLQPTLENLIIRIADAPAKSTAEGIANIIVNNIAWQLWFPEIEPKSKPGQAGGEWSAKDGYNVIDRSRDPEEWIRMEASRTSRTISKYGIAGAGTLGSRTSGLMLADDLHGDKETANETEAIKSRFHKQVGPTLRPDARAALIGTPWNEIDLTQELPDNPQWEVIYTPITLEGTWPGTPVCSEIFDEQAIQDIYDEDMTVGKKDFYLNRLLSLVRDHGQHFTFRRVQLYEDYWFHRIGCDYAAGEGQGPERSYHAIVVIAQHPESGAWIIIDGVVARVTVSQAELLMLEYWKKYKNVEVVQIEEAAGGKEYIHSLARMANYLIPIMGITPGSESKERRWEMNLEPMFAAQRIMVLDKDHITDLRQATFLAEVEQALNRYPDIRKRGDKAADILDAIYYAVYHALVAFADPVRQLPKEKKKKNPFRGFIDTKL